MNIPDVGNSPETVQVETAHTRMDAPDINTSGDTRPLRENQPPQQRDEYVRSMEVNKQERPDKYIPSKVIAIRGNLYDVSDVGQSGTVDINSRNVGSILPTGEKVDEKVLDVILSGGLKSLRVYRKKRVSNEDT
jgi:hypothetical protein